MRRSWTPQAIRIKGGGDFENAVGGAGASFLTFKVARSNREGNVTLGCEHTGFGPSLACHICSSGGMWGKAGASRSVACSQ
jgi:hypothetical protein